MQIRNKGNRFRWLFSGAFVIAGLLFVFKDNVVRARYESKRARFIASPSSAAYYRSDPKAFDNAKATAANVFEGATKVEAFRMVPWLGAPTGEGIGKIEGFPYTAQGLAQDSAFAQRLGGIVLDAKTYTSTAKSCTFNPTVGFRVWKASESVVVLICFGCSQLMILEKNAPFNEIGGIKGRFKVSGEFDLFRPELLTLAKEAFPQDPTIQHLSIYETGRLQL